MLYVLIQSARAADLSAGIQQLTRPPHLRSPDDVCRYWCDWRDHPSGNGWSVLIVPETAEVPVHVESDGALLGQTLAVFLADGAMTQDEFDGLVATVPSLAGGAVRVFDLIPPSWAPYTFDRATAIAQGFIPADEAY